MVPADDTVTAEEISHSEKGEVFSTREPHRYVFRIDRLSGAGPQTLQLNRPWRGPLGEHPPTLSPAERYTRSSVSKKEIHSSACGGFRVFLTCYHTNHRGLTLYLRGAHRLQPTSPQSLPAFIVHHQRSQIFNQRGQINCITFVSSREVKCFAGS